MFFVNVPVKASPRLLIAACVSLSLGLGALSLAHADPAKPVTDNTTDNPPARMGGEHMHRGRGPMAAEMMKRRWDKLDTNHDGVISKEEYLKEASERFDMSDANHDGKLTKEEVKAFFEKVMVLKKEARAKADAEVEAKLKQGN